MTAALPGIAWLVTLALSVPVVVLALAVLPSTRSRSPRPDDDGTLPSALYPCYTTHGRLLPAPARHAFSYPLLYVAVDVDRLAAGGLDQRRVFAYGGRPVTKLLGLRSDGYLAPGKGGLRQKLRQLLEEHDISHEQIGKIWLVTMPSYLGVEGINPLSVWYIYGASSTSGDALRLLCVVLEVHNTFGEKHAYVLKTSDAQPSPKGKEEYDFYWLFTRSFHVSPFNSRDGYYELFLVDPFSQEKKAAGQTGEIRVFLRLLAPDKQPKLHALLASSPERAPVSLDVPNVLSILRLVATYPFELFLTSVRILWQAQKLHYGKGLLVYPRPEPIHPASASEWNPPGLEQPRGVKVGHAIGWQTPSSVEALSRRIILDWAQHRADVTNRELRVEFLDGFRGPAPVVFAPQGGKPCGTVHMRTADPKLFTNLLGVPSARHYVVLAPELSTSISDPEGFVEFFACPQSEESSLDLLQRLAAITREASFRFFLSHSLIPPTPDLVLPHRHWFSGLPTWWQEAQMLWVLWVTYAADLLEEMVFHLVKARFVPGREPWKIWERALRRTYSKDDETAHEKGSETGSTDSWEDVGSVLYK